jgi:hypothetical protein
VSELQEESANDTAAWCTESATRSRKTYRGLVEEHGEAKAAEPEEKVDEVLESDEEPEAPVPNVIDVETVDSWKKAYCDWVWSADPAEAYPEKLLGWLNVWSGEEGEKVASTLRKTADAARIGLLGKRNEFRDAHHVVIVTHQAGSVGESKAMQQQLEAYSSHCRASFIAWMDMELNEQLGGLFQRREADLAGGKADAPSAAVMYTVATELGYEIAKSGKRSSKASASSTGAKGGGKGVAKDIAEKKEVLKFTVKGTGAPTPKKP